MPRCGAPSTGSGSSIGVCVAFTVYIAVIPLGFLLWQSFRTPQTATTDAVFTLGNYAEAYGSGRDAGGCSGTRSSSPLGTVALRVRARHGARVDERAHQHAVQVALLRALAHPAGHPGDPVHGRLDPARAARRSASSTSCCRSWLGLEEPLFDIYSLGGMIWVDGLHYSPMAFLLMTAAFRAMDPSLEESATMSGANIFQVAWRVTLQAHLAGDLRDASSSCSCAPSSRSRCRRCSGCRSASRCSPRPSTRRCTATRARSASPRRMR